VVQNPGDYGIHDLFDGLRSSVKRRIRGQDRRACLYQKFIILDVDEIERCFARNEDELAFLLQNNIRCPQQDVFTVSVGDAAQRAHCAGDDHHHVGRIGTAGKRCIHAPDVVHFYAVGEAQTVRQFLADDLLRIVAEHDMDFVQAGVEVVEQALRVEGAAGSGDGNENFQTAAVVARRIMEEQRSANKKLWKRTDDRGAETPTELASLSGQPAANSHCETPLRRAAEDADHPFSESASCTGQRSVFALR
jgi:hypothetical protein